MLRYTANIHRENSPETTLESLSAGSIWGIPVETDCHPGPVQGELVRGHDHSSSIIEIEKVDPMLLIKVWGHT